MSRAVKPWRITWAGHTWTDADMTGADMAGVQLLVGGDWSSVDPWRGPVQLMAVIAALWARTEPGRDVARIMDELRQAPAADLIFALSDRTDGGEAGTDG